MRRPLRDLADVHYGKSPNEVVHEDGAVPVVGTGGVYGRAVRPLFQGPAIVVPRKGSLGNPQYMSGPFWAVDTTYAVLPKKGVQARWLHYNLDLFDLTKLNEATGVPSISRDWLYKIEFEDPGEVSQQRIAEILSTVDEAIEQTEALIAKTQQIKAGLMHDLFTRGVTADGQLRPPREEAPQLYKESPLGWVPKDWSPTTLKDLGSWTSGGTPAKSQAQFWGGDIPWLTPKDMKALRPKKIHEAITEQGAISGSRVVPPGAVFIVVRGMILAHTFPVCVASRRMAFNQDIKAIVPASGVHGLFLAHWFVGNSGEMLKLVSEATHGTKRIELKDLQSYGMGLPPEPEQVAVVDIIESVEENLAVLLDEHGKLSAQKRGLMHHLLTGEVLVEVSDAPPKSKEVAASV